MKNTLKLALEALNEILESFEKDGKFCKSSLIRNELFDRLKATFDKCKAIAEAAKQSQGEPVAWMEQSIFDWLSSDARGPTAYATTTLAKRQDGKAMIPLYTTPQPKQEQGEPLCTAAMFDDAFLAKSGLSPDTKLYTTPQQRKPLTQEQIDSIPLKNLNKYNTTVAKKYLVRTVEAMHNIKE